MSTWPHRMHWERPAPGEIQVVYLPRFKYQGWLHEAECLLSERERRVASELNHPNIHSRFVLTRGALRTLLADMLGHDPTTEFDLGPRGKPGLPDAGLYFSLSHSRDCSLISFCSQAEVGVDIETLHRVINADRMMKRFFHPSEQAWWREQAKPDRAFLELWTRKEAMLKRTGQGIDVELNRVNTLDEAGESQVINLYPDDNHIGAVAVSGEPPQLGCYTWEPNV